MMVYFAAPTSNDHSVKTYNVWLDGYAEASYVPRNAKWAYKQGNVKPMVEVTDCYSPSVLIYDSRDVSSEAIIPKDVIDKYT